VLAEGAPVGQLAEPSLAGPWSTDLVPVDLSVHGEQTAGQLRRLELLVDGVPAESITFEPMARLTATFVVHFEKLGRGRYRLAARATSSSGETRTGPVLAVECLPATLPPEKLAGFALPIRRPGPVPEQIRALYGAAAGDEDGTRVFFVHAPSIITYALPAGATRLGGRFGFRPGAYAESNPGRTDGAEFIITSIGPGGERTDLLRQLLRPTEVPADRGEHAFAFNLPDPAKRSRIELTITNGPSGNAASDWTYWSDLLLTVAP
jgi:hypothetical protein